MKKKKEESRKLRCKDCGRVLPEDKFNYWNKEKGQRMNICKSCERKRKRDSYGKKRDIIHELKSVGCCVCGEKDVCCLDFHHVDPRTKEFSIGSGMNKPEWKILDEASKCVVVCANCHRKIHAGALNVEDYVNMNQYRYVRLLMSLKARKHDGNPEKR